MGTDPADDQSFPTPAVPAVGLLGRGLLIALIGCLGSLSVLRRSAARV
jgi:hypothetical protein